MTKELNYSKADAAEKLRPWLRSGMMRLLLMILITVCTLIAAFISTSSLAFFCTANSGRKLEVLNTTRDLLHDDISGKQIGAGCDYTVGKWVKSEVKPLYSGDACKQWLAGMWACRLMPGRPDFDYENYRWQPDACDLPVFDSQEFLSRMRNKVLAFIGDSIGRQQHQSLMCMLTGGKDDAMVTEDVSVLYGLEKPAGSLRADGTAHRFLETNTTIIYYWSASLCDVQPLNKTDPDTYYAMHLDRPVMFLQKFVGIMDVVVLNTGHHWNKGKVNGNRWVMHVDGELNTDPRFRAMGFARNFSLGKIIAWLDDQIIHNNTRAEVYMRSLSPRHFFEGEWDSGGRCDNNLVPVEEKRITGDQAAADPIAESAVRGRRAHLLNITYISQFRDEAHISKYRPSQSGQDCLHWCLPGVPDLWNELLYADLFCHGGSRLRMADHTRGAKADVLVLT